MSLTGRWTDLICRVATGSWKVGLVVAPVAAVTFAGLIGKGRNPDEGGVVMNHSGRLYPAIAIVLILIGLLFLVPGCRSLWSAYASPGWPVAAGSIQSSEVAEFQTGTDASRNRPVMFSASIVFKYSVNGRSHTTGTVCPGRTAWSEDSSEAEMLHLRYPKGASVDVHYDPADPATAVLEPGVKPDDFWFPAIGLAFLLPGIAFWIARWMFRAEQNWVNLSGNLIAASLVISGAAMLTTGVRGLKLGWESLQWPVIEGVMVCSPYEPQGSTLQERGRRDEMIAPGKEGMRSGLVYEYEAQGRKHYGMVWRFGSPSLFNHARDREFRQRYALGRPVKVSFSARNPSLAVLEPGVIPDAWWIPVIGAFLLLGGLAVCLFAVPLLAGIRPGAMDASDLEPVRRIHEQGHR